MSLTDQQLSEPSLDISPTSIIAAEVRKLQLGPV
jgi:hypothetical protein